MTIFLTIVFLVHLISWVLYQKHQFKEHDSIKSASIQFNSDKSPIISRCCNNHQKKGLGYIWKFKSINK